MPAPTVEETLAAWANRQGLQMSDKYRDRFFYFDISDNSGGKYEISIHKAEESGLIKVRVDSNRRRSCGFIHVPASDLDEVLEKAVSQIKKWIQQSGKTQGAFPRPKS